MRPLFLFVIFFLQFLIKCIPSMAQSNKLGSWNVLNLKTRITNKTTLQLEGQLRSQSFYNDFFYYEYKGALNFKLQKGFELLVGIGKYNTYQFIGNFEKPKQNNEIRPWQQITYKHKWGKLNIDHRLRLEQRFFESNYRNRFRYRLNTILPINTKEINQKSYYLTFFNEFFFNNEVPRFERNRMFIGVGYEFSEVITVQTGWLFQYDIGANKEIGKHFVQSSILLTIPRKKDRQQVHFDTLD